MNTLDYFIIKSPVASVIFAFTIIISLYTIYFNNSLLNKFMLHPYSFIKEKRYYTIITSGFVHAGFQHLLFNMITFFFFGFYLEQLVGSWRFALIYLISMIAGDIHTIIKNKNDENYRCLGASGAISGVIFSSILFNPWSRIYMFLIPIGIPAFVFAFLYLAYCVFSEKYFNNYINHLAHFWGALSGVITTIILMPDSVFIFINRLLKI